MPRQEVATENSDDNNIPTTMYEWGSFIATTENDPTSTNLPPADYIVTEDGFTNDVLSLTCLPRFRQSEPSIILEGDDHLKYLKHIFSDTFIAFMTDKTNSSIPPEGKVKQVSSLEVKKFIGILIFMTIMRPRAEYLLWRNADDELNTRNDFIVSLLPYRRWKVLKNHFRLTEQGFDIHSDIRKCQQKTSKIVKIFNSSLHKLVGARRELSIDESMCAFTGRAEAKTWLPNKPIKEGFKFYMLCESLTGYVLVVRFYDLEKMSLLETIQKLCKEFSNKNHRLYMDNFYNSFDTSIKLRELGIYCCGTLRKNRGEPKAFKTFTKSDIKKNDVCFMHKEDIAISYISDKKKFMFISTFHSSTTSNLTLNPSPTKNNVRTYHYVSKIPFVKDYDKYMGGVDKFDQYISNYCLDRKTDRWSFRFSTFLLNIQIQNSFIAFKNEFFPQDAPTDLHFKYMLQVARWFLGLETTNVSFGNLSAGQRNIDPSHDNMRRNTRTRRVIQEENRATDTTLPDIEEAHENNEETPGPEAENSTPEDEGFVEVDVGAVKYHIKVNDRYNFATDYDAHVPCKLKLRKRCVRCQSTHKRSDRKTYLFCLVCKKAFCDDCWFEIDDHVCYATS